MIEWLIAAAAIAGAILNAYHYKEGFLVWIVANTAWTGVAIQNGLWAQVPMWSVYSAISVWGYLRWRDE
jgi:membrane protein implicated in regulation of membrane protease activity